VKKILRGYRREETSRFIAFRPHWRFMSECSPSAQVGQFPAIEEEMVLGSS